MEGIRCTQDDLWTVAQTVWGEARGEPSQGLYAVAWVIRNRHDLHPSWKGKAFVEICHAPMQFSCWIPGDPNRTKLRAVSLDDRVFCACLVAVVQVLGGQAVSPVGRSTHYYAETALPSPLWAAGHTPFVVIGHHRFFEGIS